MKLVFLLSVAVLIASCQPAETSETKEAIVETNAPVEPEEVEDSFDAAAAVAALKTNPQKLNFFKYIIQKDMQVRADQIEALQNYGYNSDENKKATALVKKADKRNLESVTEFLKVNGLPEENSAGRMESEVLLLVARNSEQADVHEDLFQAVRKGWQYDFLDDVQVAAYLHDWYELSTGDRLELENPYTTLDEIKALRTKLGV